MSKPTNTSNLPILTDAVGEVIDMDALLTKLETIDGRQYVFSEAELHVDTPPAPPQPDVYIRAKKIHNRQATFSRNQLTCWDFDVEALENCAKYLNQPIALHIEDDNGLFTPQTPQVITAFKADGNKLLILTENQK